MSQYQDKKKLSENGGRVGKMMEVNHNKVGMCKEMDSNGRQGKKPVLLIKERNNSH